MNLPHSPESKIRRDRNGRWFDGPDPIEHPGIERAFDRWVDRAPDGRYILRNDSSWAYVEIEGPPVFVQSARMEGGTVWLGLSDGREEVLSPATLWQDSEGHLYTQVRDGRLYAQFLSAALAEIEPALFEEDGSLTFRLSGLTHSVLLRRS